MRIAKVIGTVTLSRWHPSLDGSCYRLAIPLALDELSGGELSGGEPAGEEPAGEELVVYDSLGAGVGSLIAISEGGEAAQPFLPELKPVDAYNAAILDSIDLRGSFNQC